MINFNLFVEKIEIIAVVDHSLMAVCGRSVDFYLTFRFGKEGRGGERKDKSTVF